MAKWYSYLPCGITLRPTCDTEVLITCIMILSGKDKNFSAFEITPHRIRVTKFQCLHFSCSDVVRITDEFKNEIGKGGSAKVYRGRLSASHTEVAVKVLLPSSDTGFEQFRNEASLLYISIQVSLILNLLWCSYTFLDVNKKGKSI